MIIDIAEIKAEITVLKAKAEKLEYIQDGMRFNDLIHHIGDLESLVYYAENTPLKPKFNSLGVRMTDEKICSQCFHLHEKKEDVFGITYRCVLSTDPLDRKKFQIIFEPEKSFCSKFMKNQVEEQS